MTKCFVFLLRLLMIHSVAYTDMTDRIFIQLLRYFALIKYIRFILINRQKSVMISPFPSSPQKYPSEKNVSEKSTEFNSQSLNSNSTALIDTKSSSFTEQFSLTAPDTFSDGMWLLDRSEGEAPYPVSYNKLKLIMSKMEPIRSSTTRRNVSHSISINTQKVICITKSYRNDNNFSDNKLNTKMKYI